MKTKLSFAIVTLMFFYCGVLLAANEDIYFSNSLRKCESHSVISTDGLLNTAMIDSLDPCKLVSIPSTDLRIIRNSIYAKHGRPFSDPALKAYFQRTSWYKENPAYNDSLLSDVQSKNIELLAVVEDLKRIKKNKGAENRHIDELRNANFPPLDKYASLVRNLPKAHPSITIRGNSILFNTTKTIDLARRAKELYPYPEQPDIRIIEKGVLIMYPYTGPVMHGCKSEIYSFEGSLLQTVPFCPDFVLTKNLTLLIASHYSGCCGAAGWDFGIFDSSSGKMESISCGEDCSDIILTYLPNHDIILFSLLEGSYQFERFSWNKSRLWLFDGTGHTVSYGMAINIDTTSDKSNLIYSPANLVGINKLGRENKWLLKFIDNENEYFCVLSESAPKEKEKGAIIIDSLIVKDGETKNVGAKVYRNGIYKGLTPYKEYLDSGKYTFKLEYPGFRPHEESVIISPGEIYQIWPYLQR